MNAAQIAKHFNMEAHPEGGYFLETYRSDLEVNSLDFESPRLSSTGIYFLMEKNNFSAFHRIKSDEMWHFYLGSPLIVIEITPEGTLIETKIGRDILKGEKLQYVVKKGHWFASYCTNSEGFSFVGCTVSPGFEYRDFELAKREELSQQYPAHKDIITKLTRL